MCSEQQTFPAALPVFPYFLDISLKIFHPCFHRLWASAAPKLSAGEREKPAYSAWPRDKTEKKREKCPWQTVDSELNLSNLSATGFKWWMTRDTEKAACLIFHQLIYHTGHNPQNIKNPQVLGWLLHTNMETWKWYNADHCSFDSSRWKRCRF